MAVHRVDPKRRSSATLDYLKKHKLPSDFPLTPHKGSGQWRTKIHGRTVNFGKLDDPKAALELYNREIEARIRGLPIPGADDITVSELFDQWLEEKRKDAEAGQIKERTWRDYKTKSKFIVAELGARTAVSSLKPPHFGDLHRALDRRYGTSPTVFSHAVRITKMAFKYGDDFDIVDTPKMGRFKGASKKQVRKKRRSHGRQVYTREEILSLLERASPIMRAAILVGINGGYTQAEVADLQKSWIQDGFIDQLRDKTGTDRRVPLWPETIEAIEAMPKYKADNSATGYLFVTRTGRTYIANKGDNGIGQSFSRLLKALDIKLSLSGFGKLRATFSTVADAVGDRTAKQVIMGHSIGEGVDEHYNRFNDDERLKAVTDHVRDWLFTEKQ